MKIILFTGAGISVESGISSFRDNNGLWEKNNLDVVCNIATWKMNFNKVHDFYNQRRFECNLAEPNAFHKQVASWHRKYHLINLTQNIDNLFERADCPADEVVHLHGDINSMKCTACGHVWNFYGDWNPNEDRCRCGSRKGVKPNVIFFGEVAPKYMVLYKTLKEATKGDFIIVAGTSGEVIEIGSLIFDSPATKILMDINSPDWAPGIFEKEFIGPATRTVKDVDGYIINILDPSQ